MRYVYRALTLLGGHRAQRVMGAATLVGLAATVAIGLFVVPPDAEQGDVQRLMYVHVPAAWVTYLSFGAVFVASIAYLRTGRIQWDRVACASAEIGVRFCALTIVLGALWGRPVWGTWWTWDPRLTLTLILWMIYAAYLLLRSLANEPQQGATLAAILGVSGVVDLYLINRAVYWWRGIHPAVIVNKEGGSGLADPLMRLTLVVCMLAFFLLFLWLLRLRIRTARMQDTVDDLRAQLAPATF